MGKYRERAEKVAGEILGTNWVAPKSLRARLKWAWRLLVKPADTIASLRVLVHEQVSEHIEKDLNEQAAAHAKACEFSEKILADIKAGKPLPAHVQVIDLMPKPQAAPSEPLKAEIELNEYVARMQKSARNN